MPKPPLDLAAEITVASGATFRWDPSKRAGDRLQNITFRTRLGDGFADASGTLSRRGDRDWADLNLIDDFALIGADGSVAYEGRLGANPRSFDSGSGWSLTVQTAGWMTHAKDRKFQEIYVDRELSRWGGASVQRKISAAGSTQIIDASTKPDTTTGAPSLTEEIPDQPWTTAGLPRVEAYYDAGSGVLIGSVYYAWKINGNIGSGDANWSWDVQASTDDILTSTDNSGSLRAAGPSSGTLATTGSNKRFAKVSLAYGAASASASGKTYGLYWTCLAVYGTHGLTKQGTADATNAQGFFASDVIKDIASRFCPKLNTNGVQATSLVIPQIAYLDRTYPYDAFLDLNKYHLWELAVWEGKTLTYRPLDLTDYDWEVRLSDRGVSTTLQGDQLDATNGSFANGISVEYTDVTSGKKGVLTPLTNPADLADTSPNNPANQHGIQLWTELTLSSPTTSAIALSLGRAALAEFNRPKAAGTITVKGHIRDRAGHWQQGWKVRAGDTVSITDVPNDIPRLVTETSWNHDAKELTITVDGPPKTLDAVQDRILTALQAQNVQV